MERKFWDRKRPGGGEKWVHFVAEGPLPHRQTEEINHSASWQDVKRRSKFTNKLEQWQLGSKRSLLCCSHPPLESHWLQTASKRCWAEAAGNCWLITIPNCANDRKWVNLASSVIASSILSLVISQSVNSLLFVIYREVDSCYQCRKSGWPVMKRLPLSFINNPSFALASLLWRAFLLNQASVRQQLWQETNTQGLCGRLQTQG